MEDSHRHAVRQAVLEEFGVDKYNRLISIVANTADRGNFRYWQEELFARLYEKTGFNIKTVAEYSDIFRNAPCAKKEITLEQFLSEPSRYYYTEPVEIPDEWIVQAWEQSDKFRENLTYEYSREASKNGDLDCLETSLRHLTRILPMTRIRELYCSIRDTSPHRESEFRPTFERIFGKKMVGFPEMLTDQKVIDILGEEIAREMGIGRQDD